MKTYELMPKNGRKSFYKKAIVRIEDDGTQVLFSYGMAGVRQPEGI